MPITLAVALQGWVTRTPGLWLSPDGDRTTPAVGSGTVLVVDDDRNVRRLTARMLRAEGYRVLEAGSGPEALAVLEQESGVHLMVTDIVMPDMDGLKLADEALSRLPGLKVLLMTGHAPELTVQLDLRKSPLPVLLKPFSKEQLSGKVKKALEGERG